ncbi:short-chain dehydrogenase [Frankia sp. R43]|uniref:SDR family oxidoreductase n=1 Tax=Frankia sp. R43 TaxID=269536 RepID=UPI0006C9EA4A|nr:SDR family oxidoreductase [Frankia sp. R43]KPM51942.1 short-chain dehydrogenase [Frankia sp. R43]
MGKLNGRVAVITGAGRGLGRDHALLFATEGAMVVVNDVGGEASPAHDVVAEIRAAGGEAVAHTESVTEWDAAKRLVDMAVRTFGDLHVVVNNAGILRDRMLVNMTEDEWDSVISVHLKGHFCVTRHAAAYWREQSKANATVDRSLIHTTSTSGLFANPGQANYGAAKSGIASFSQIAAKELGRFGVRSNSVAPVARTRLTLSIPGVGEKIAEVPEGFDKWDPANVSPLIAYLATEQCEFTGETFNVIGGQITRIQSWTSAEQLAKEERWSVDDLIEAGPSLVGKGIDKPVMAG